MATDSYRREVTDLVEAGWRIEEETADRVTLVKRAYGDPGIHILIAVFTIWWAIGVPNLLYGAYKYLADSDRTIVWKRPQPGGSGTVETSEPAPDSASWSGELEPTDTAGEDVE